MPQETKTAEEIAALSRKKFIDHLIWCIDNAKKLYADQSEMYEKIISRKQSELTQQQSANAELEKQNEELVAFLKQLYNIEDPIWRLKSFDVDRIKREISELINTPPKN